MSLVLNMVGGGGGSLKDTDAILTVTVPTGSTVTMTKGGVTLTPTMWVQAADPTLDCALFVIAPNLFDAVNAWTVTATLGTDTASDTIVVDTNSAYYVTLAYVPYLYNLGDTHDDVTGGYGNDHGSGSAVTFESDYIKVYQIATGGRGAVVYTQNTINVSSFKTLYVEYTHSSEISEYARFGLGNSTLYADTGFTVSARFTASSVKKVGSCDITNITGAYRVRLYDGVGDLRIYRIWLEYA